MYLFALQVLFLQKTLIQRLCYNQHQFYLGKMIKHADLIYLQVPRITCSFPLWPWTNLSWDRDWIWGVGREVRDCDSALIQEYSDNQTKQKPNKQRQTSHNSTQY